MTVNLNPRLRLALYVLTVIGTPVVVYLRASGIIGDLELGLWGAEVAAVSSLAALNTSTTTPTVGSAGMLSPQEIEHYQRGIGVGWCHTSTCVGAPRESGE